MAWWWRVVAGEGGGRGEGVSGVVNYDGINEAMPTVWATTRD